MLRRGRFPQVVHEPLRHGDWIIVGVEAWEDLEVAAPLGVAAQQATYLTTLVVVVDGKATALGLPSTQRAASTLSAEEGVVVLGGEGATTDGVGALEPRRVRRGAGTGLAATPARVCEPYERLATGAPAPTGGPLTFWNASQAQVLGDALSATLSRLHPHLDGLAL